MNESETTIKLKQSTKSRLRDARRKLSHMLNITLMSDDATLDALIDDWSQRSGEDVAGDESSSSSAQVVAAGSAVPMVQQRLV